MTFSIHDLPESVDSVNWLPDKQVELENQNVDVTVGDDDLDRHHYDLRPRRVPRITSDWSTNKWTNVYHTNRLDLKQYADSKREFIWVIECCGISKVYYLK